MIEKVKPEWVEYERWLFYNSGADVWSQVSAFRVECPFCGEVFNPEEYSSSCKHFVEYSGEWCYFEEEDDEEDH